MCYILQAKIKLNTISDAPKSGEKNPHTIKHDFTFRSLIICFPERNIDQLISISYIASLTYIYRPIYKTFAILCEPTH